MKKIFTYSILALAAFATISFIIVSVRQRLAKQEIEAEWQTLPSVVPELAVTSRLEILPLYEAASKTGELISGHGVSYLIRTDTGTILLDVGNNPDQLTVAPFIQNMQALGIDWDDVHRIVISHPHPDHTGGTKSWWNAIFSMSGSDITGSLEDRMIFVPTDLAFAGAVHVTIPTLPAPDVATTGVISYPEVFPLSLIEPKGSEQALVINVAGQGLVMITGCGHPGLEKLVERAEALYGQMVIGVVGGLHYGNAAAQEIEPHIQFLQTRQPGLVALSPHDSSPEVLAAFETAFGGRYHTLRVGEVIQFPE